MTLNLVPLSQPKVRLGPSGIHIFDRNTGLNLLLDEVKLPPISWAIAPRQVSIALTNICDLACPYCYAPKNSSTLDFEQVADWLVELDAEGCLSVGFGGGEPTLYRRFAELCRYASQNTKLAITFTTHSHHLTDTLIASLVGNIHFVRISMDGIGKTYELFRGRSFAKLLHQLKRIRNFAPFGINYVVNAQTLADLDNAIRIASENGAAEFLLLPEQPVHGRGGIDSNTVEALRKWVVQYSGTVPLTISEIGADGMPICNPLADEIGLQAYAHIDASGTIKRSSYDGMGVAIGPEGVMSALEKLRRSYGGQAK